MHVGQAGERARANVLHASLLANSEKRYVRTYVRARVRCVCFIYMHVNASFYKTYTYVYTGVHVRAHALDYAAQLTGVLYPVLVCRVHSYSTRSHGDAHEKCCTKVISLSFFLIVRHETSRSKIL